MSREPSKAALVSTSMQNPEHLLRWLQQSGRRYMVLDTKDLSEALVKSYGWPDGAAIIQDMLARYKEHRSSQFYDYERGPDGKKILTRDVAGREVPVGKPKSDQLTLVEVDRAIRQLVQQATEMDQKWSLDNSPL